MQSWPGPFQPITVIWTLFEDSLLAFAAGELQREEEREHREKQDDMDLVALQSGCVLPAPLSSLDRVSKLPCTSYCIGDSYGGRGRPAKAITEITSIVVHGLPLAFCRVQHFVSPAGLTARPVYGFIWLLKVCIFFVLITQSPGPQPVLVRHRSCAPRRLIPVSLLHSLATRVVRMCANVYIDYTEYFYYILLQFLALSFTSFSTERLELVAVETNNA